VPLPAQQCHALHGCDTRERGAGRNQRHTKSFCWLASYGPRNSESDTSDNRGTEARYAEHAEHWVAQSLGCQCNARSCNQDQRRQTGKQQRRNVQKKGWWHRALNGTTWQLQLQKPPLTVSLIQ